MKMKKLISEQEFYDHSISANAKITIDDRWVLHFADRIEEWIYSYNLLKYILIGMTMK